MVCIEQVNQNCIDELAKLYVDIYKETNPVERWSISSAKKFITYYYKLCPELFFVAKAENKIVAGIWGPIKPWWNGNKVYDLEIFVEKKYQRKGISKIILEHYLNIAIKKYRIVSVEAITFSDREFPLNYYDKIALRKDRQLVLLEGNAHEILAELSYH